MQFYYIVRVGHIKLIRKKKEMSPRLHSSTRGGVNASQASDEESSDRFFYFFSASDSLNGSVLLVDLQRQSKLMTHSVFLAEIFLITGTFTTSSPDRLSLFRQ